MMYMKISLSDFLTVFAARTRKPFFSRMPGGLLFGAATVALGTSTLFSAYWPFPELKPLEWSLLGIVRTPAQLLASPCVLIGLTRACGALQIWAYCFVWFLLQDVAKILLFNLIECLEPSVMGLPCFKSDDAIEKLSSRLSALERAVEDFTVAHSAAAAHGGGAAARASRGHGIQ